MCQLQLTKEVWSCGERIEALRYHQSEFVSGNLSSGSVVERQNDKQVVGWGKKRIMLSEEKRQK